MEAIFTAAKEMGFIPTGDTTMTTNISQWVVTLTPREDGWIEIDCWGNYVIECRSPEQVISMLPGVLRTISLYSAER